jgi:hypothetical protein
MFGINTADGWFWLVLAGSSEPAPSIGINIMSIHDLHPFSVAHQTSHTRHRQLRPQMLALRGFSTTHRHNGYNAAMTLQRRIAAAADEVRKRGGHPHEVHLRPTDAIQLQYELLSEGGELAHSIMQNGVGRAVPQILGLQIVWKSTRFCVE